MIEDEVSQALADVHALLIQTLLTTGSLPPTQQLSAALQLPTEELAQRLHQLAELHGLVLQPYAPEPWVVHPFSTTPTLHFVEGEAHGWWAPCIWCAFGIAQLAGGSVRIHTRLAGETEPIALQVQDGYPQGDDNLLVHFSIPPRHAWKNVHQHCSLVLPFRSQVEIVAWCHAHGQSFGEAVPLATTAALARRWYAPYAERSWRKWTVEQAQEIFHKIGLTSQFWKLSGEGTY